MKDCVFCKIVSGEFDSAKIWEDDRFLAILDIAPNTKGVTLVMSKKHFPSYFFNLGQEAREGFIQGAQKVARMLEKGLNVKRVGLAIEGMGINHAHLKLYPFCGIDQWQVNETKEKVFFEKYPGFLTTKLGPQKDLEKLKGLAQEIKSA